VEIRPSTCDLLVYPRPRRRRAALFAWRESAAGDAAECPSRFSALRTARDRFGDGFPDEAD